MIGRMSERLTVQTTAPLPVVVASLTRASTTATVTTASAHGWTTGDFVTVAGASPSAYNGRVKVTVTNSTVCTYTIAGSPTTPATGAITATLASDAQGGRETTTRTVDTVWAEKVPQRAAERLQAQGMGSQTDYRFKVRARADVAPAMTALWTPRWPIGAAAVTLEIHGVLPDTDRAFMLLDCGVRL